MIDWLLALALLLGSSATSSTSGAISGVALSEPENRPLAAATVSAWDDSRGAEAAGQRAATDENGRFSFRDLLPGRYRVRISTFQHPIVEFGAFHVNEPGTPVVVTGDASVAIVVRVPRGPSLSGIVLTSQGEPAPDVRVVASLARNRRKAVADVLPSYSATTDGRGAYRIEGMVPDEYIVSAVPVTSLGEYLFPTLYPGTNEREKAIPVTIAQGEQRDSLNFSLVSMQAATSAIRGKVLRPDGEPAANIWVCLDNGAGFATQVKSDSIGQFVLHRLLPGRYFILADASDSIREGDGPLTRLPMRYWWAEEIMDVPPGTTVEPTLRLQSTASLSGSIVHESPPRPTTERLSLVSLDRPDPPLWVAVQGGTFEARGIRSGRFRIALDALGDNESWLRSISAGGHLLSSDELTFDREGAGIQDVVLAVSRDRGAITGRVIDNHNQPASDYWVAAVPTILEQSVSVRPVRTRPDTNGQFVFRALPIGEYRVAVVRDLGTSSWEDPALVENMKQAGVHVVVRVGQVGVVQDLRIDR